MEELEVCLWKEAPKEEAEKCQDCDGKDTNCYEYSTWEDIKLSLSGSRQ